MFYRGNRKVANSLMCCWRYSPRTLHLALYTDLPLKSSQFLTGNALKGEGEYQAQVEQYIDTDEGPFKVPFVVSNGYEYTEILKQNGDFDKKD